MKEGDVNVVKNYKLPIKSWVCNVQFGDYSYYSCTIYLKIARRVDLGTPLEKTAAHMIMNVNSICVDHFTVYANIKSLCVSLKPNGLNTKRLFIFHYSTRFIII